MSTFKSVVTTLGQSRIAAAIAAGTDINITQLAVGDGNGKATTPVATQTKLVKEVYRTPLNSLKLDPSHANWVIAEAVIFASVGGFWMREMGLFADDGALIAVCNMADTYKPTLAEGSGRTQTLRMVIAVSGTEAISLLIDDSVIMATEQYVNDLLAAHEKSRNHPDGTLTAKGFVQLSSSVSSTSEVLAATPKAVKAANDNANTRVPSTRKVNNKPLSADMTLEATDVGALPVASAVLGTVNINTLNLAKIGLYVQSTGANATVANGYPAGSQAAGVLEVIPASWTGGVLQRYTVQNTGMVWTRALNASWNGTDGPWRDWVQLSAVNSVNVPTTFLAATDINTLGFASGTGRADVYAQTKNAQATPALHYPELKAGTLYVTPSAYGCQQMYVTFEGNTWNRGLSGDWNGVDGPWKEWVPTYGANNKPTAADVGALASTGGVVTGEIKGTSAVFSGSVTQRENIVSYRQLISRTDAFSAYTTYNRLDQVEGVRPGSVIAVGDIAARLTTAAGDPYGRTLGGVSFQYNTTGGGRLVLNARNDTGVVKSSLTLDGDTGNTTIVGDVDFNGMVKFNQHEATCQFSASDTAYPLINVNYSNAGNFGFWDANNAKWLLRKRASNLTTGNADNWVMESGGLEITGAYGLTLATALPVASGGTGAKTAADAVKNLGALPITGGKLTGDLTVKQLLAEGGLISINGYMITRAIYEGGNQYARYLFTDAEGKETLAYLEADFLKNLNFIVNNRTFSMDNQGALKVPTAIYEAGKRVYSPNNPQPISAKSVASLGAVGWARNLDTGEITQWGNFISGSGQIETRSFPIAFPNICAVITGSVGVQASGNVTANFEQANNMSFNSRLPGAGYGAYWIAKGY